MNWTDFSVWVASVSHCDSVFQSILLYAGGKNKAAAWCTVIPLASSGIYLIIIGMELVCHNDADGGLNHDGGIDRLAVGAVLIRQRIE